MSQHTHIEEWRPIPGYEGHYEVSSMGRVKSVKRVLADGRMWREKILKPWHDGGGYKQVYLSKNAVATSRHIHFLVASAFLGPRPDGNEIRHLNGDNNDNRIANLAYGTKSDNMLDAVRHGTHGEAKKTHCIRGHKLEDPNLRAAAKKRGARACLACGRAHSYVRANQALKPFFDEISNSYYEQIINAA